MKKIIKMLIIAVLIFILLTALIAALMKFEVIPDKYIKVYMYVVLSVCIFFLGMVAGGMLPWRGVITGALVSLIILLLWLLICSAKESFVMDTFLNKSLIAPFLSGVVGGIVGSNNKNK